MWWSRFHFQGHFPETKFKPGRPVNPVSVLATAVFRDSECVVCTPQLLCLEGSWWFKDYFWTKWFALSLVMSTNPTTATTLLTKWLKLLSLYNSPHRTSNKFIVPPFEPLITFNIYNLINLLLKLPSLYTSPTKLATNLSFLSLSF